MWKATWLPAARLGLCAVLAVVFAVGGASGYTLACVAVLLIEAGRQLEDRCARGRARGEGSRDELLRSLADVAYRFTIALCFLSAGLVPVWVVLAILYVVLLVACIQAQTLGSRPAATGSVSARILAFTWVVVPLVVLWTVLRTSPIDPFAWTAMRGTARWLMVVVLGVTLVWGAANVVRNRALLRKLLRPRR